MRLLLDSAVLIDHFNDIDQKAAALRRRHRWKLPDAFQAALAKHHKLRLVTRDVRDFRPEVHRFVVVP